MGTLTEYQYSLSEVVAINCRSVLLESESIHEIGDKEILS